MCLLGYDTGLNGFISQEDRSFQQNVWFYVEQYLNCWTAANNIIYGVMF
jgi:hypothetical protein